MGDWLAMSRDINAWITEALQVLSAKTPVTRFARRDEKTGPMSRFISAAVVVDESSTIARSKDELLALPSSSSLVAVLDSSEVFIHRFMTSIGDEEPDLRIDRLFHGFMVPTLAEYWRQHGSLIHDVATADEVLKQIYQWLYCHKKWISGGGCSFGILFGIVTP